MKNVETNMVFSLNSQDRTFLKERAATMQKSNEQIEDLINEQKRMVPYLHTVTEELGDRRKFLFEIPFNAVAFYDLDDKVAYEKGTFVNFAILNIHSIKVYYAEFFRSGTGHGIDTKLGIFFLSDVPNKSDKKDVRSYHYAKFDDENLCFAEHFVFQTEEQYVSFKKIYAELKKLAEEMGLSL